MSVSDLRCLKKIYLQKYAKYRFMCFEKMIMDQKNLEGLKSYQLMSLIFMAVLGYLVQLFYKSFVSRAIDDSALFGDFSLSLAMIQLLGTVLSLGFVTTIKAYFINYKKNNLYTLLSGIVFYASRVLLISILGFCALFALLSWGISEAGVKLDEYEHIVWPLLLTAPFYLILMSCSVLFNLLGNIMLSQFCSLFLRPIAFIFAFFILINIGVEIKPAVLVQTVYYVFIGITLMLLTALITIIWLKPRSFPVDLKKWDLSDRSKWWSSSFTFLFMSFSYIFLMNLDLYSLELFNSEEHIVGVWVVITTIPSVIRVVTANYFGALNPYIQNAKDNQSLQELINRFNRFHLIVMMVLTVLIVLFSESLLASFGSRYVQYQSLLWISLSSVLCNSIGGDVAYVCLAYRYRELEWLRMYNIGFLIISSICLPLASYSFGLWGVAWFNLVIAVL